MSSQNEKELRIVRLNGRDISGRSDNAIALSKLIAEHDDMYPGIDKWFEKKVIPGIINGERVGFIGLHDGAPIISAIVKKGELSKFCHLHIADSFRDTHLGEVFFCMMAAEVRHFSRSKNVHFTLPQTLWDSKKDFFQSFSFKEAKLAESQYRLFDQEFECQTSFEELWGAVLEKIPKLVYEYSSHDSIVNGLLFSIKPEYANKIMKGEKAVEIRKKFNAKYIGQKAAIYSSRPIQAIVGEALISDVEHDSPDFIWEKYSGILGCTRQEFDRYTEACEQVYAVVLDQIRPYPISYSLMQMEHLTGQSLKPPQSYCSIESSQGWAKALTITEFLQGRFALTGEVAK